MEQFRLADMTMADYPAVIKLWQSADGIGLSTADEPAAIASFLARNPALSSVAYAGSELVGAVLCGHDGRRGYIHHLAVRHDHRHQGIGRRLAERCLAGLDAAGIDKCHLFVFHDNQAAQEFWRAAGWFDRSDIRIMSTYV